MLDTDKIIVRDEVLVILINTQKSRHVHTGCSALRCTAVPWGPVAASCVNQPSYCHTTGLRQKPRLVEVVSSR